MPPSEPTLLAIDRREWGDALYWSNGARHWLWECCGEAPRPWLPGLIGCPRHEVTAAILAAGGMVYIPIVADWRRGDGE